MSKEEEKESGGRPPCERRTWSVSVCGSDGQCAGRRARAALTAVERNWAISD
jgi:hypothetical protein